MKNTLLLTIFICCISSNIFGQEKYRLNLSLPDTISVPNVTEYSKRWNVMFENQDISMSYRFEDCHIKESGMHKEKVFLKFDNKTSQDIELSYYIITWRGEKCSNCNPDNNNFVKTVRIPANNVIEGFCGIDAPRELEVFSKHLNHKSSRLIDFKVTNLNLTKIKK